MIKGGWPEWYDWGGNDHLDPEMRPVSRALYDTGLVIILGTCSGSHFAELVPTCAEQRAPVVRFLATQGSESQLDTVINEILETVLFDDLQIVLTKRAVVHSEVEVQWSLEYRCQPRLVHLQSPTGGRLEEDEVPRDVRRETLLHAFEKTIEVCRHGAWRPLAGL